MTAAQAAQQTNRTNDGKYATKTHPEHDTFTPPGATAGLSGDEAEAAQRVAEYAGYDTIDDFPDNPSAYGDNDERRAFLDACSAVMEDINTASDDGVDVFVGPHYDGSGDIEGYVIGATLEPEQGMLMQFSMNAGDVSDIHGGGPAPESGLDTYRAVRAELESDRARYLQQWTRLTFNG